MGVSRVLCQFSKEQIRKKDKAEIVKRMDEEIGKEGEFRGALSMATNDAKNIKIVYDTVKQIMGD